MANIHDKENRRQEAIDRAEDALEDARYNEGKQLQALAKKQDAAKRKKVAKKMNMKPTFEKIAKAGFNPFSLVTHINGKPIKKDKYSGEKGAQRAANIFSR